MELRDRALKILVAVLALGCARQPSSSPLDHAEGRQLFILAGQSNMAGRGLVEDEDRVANARVEMFARDLAWKPAVDPVHFDKPIAGVGPGRSFGLALSARHPQLHVGLIPTAVGGSSIASWAPGAFDAATGTHPYDDALTRARTAMRDGQLQAVLWHQGESDANPAGSVLYAGRLRALIARFRSDLGAPNLPFIIGELGQFSRAPWSDAKIRVDSAQRAIAATTPNVAFVTSYGLLDKGDTTHFDAPSARELGRRFAFAYERLVHPAMGVAQSPGNEGNGVEPQPEPYVVPREIEQRIGDAAVGTLSEPALYASRIYGLKFKYRIYVPAQYRPGKPAALMVFQDARSVYLGLMKTPQVFDELIRDGSMPMTIGLFLDPGTPSGEYVAAESRDLRSMEYDATDDKYVRFLTDEIIPDVVRTKYEIVDDPDGWAIAGQSSGGIAAFTAAWQRPDRFRKVLTQNGSFVGVNRRGGDRYPGLIRAAPPKPIRVYLTSGTKDLDNEWGRWLAANEAMASALGERGYAVRLRTGTGGHFPPVQAQADFPAALRWLWRGYSLP